LRKRIGNELTPTCAAHDKPSITRTRMALFRVLSSVTLQIFQVSSLLQTRPV
jgi:hypothetical protein